MNKISRMTDQDVRKAFCDLLDKLHDYAYYKYYDDYDWYEKFMNYDLNYNYDYPEK